MLDVCCRQFQTVFVKSADVSELHLPGNFSYSDGTVLDLVKFAELRVSDCKGKGKRMTKGQKHLSVMQVVPWVSIVTCKVKN